MDMIKDLLKDMMHLLIFTSFVCGVVAGMVIVLFADYRKEKKENDNNK